MVKIVSRSSMVSVFEKPKFRDYAKSLSSKSKEVIARGLEELLYGVQPQGFEAMVEVLRTGKLAKWTLMTIIPVYHRPDFEVFIKPTTVKGIITYFELENLQYKPTPSWSFYSDFRAILNEMKTMVDPSLSPNNAAFSGFLLMVLEGL
jgi:hypothetical protein